MTWTTHTPAIATALRGIRESLDTLLAAVESRDIHPYEPEALKRLLTRVDEDLHDAVVEIEESRARWRAMRARG